MRLQSSSAGIVPDRSTMFAAPQGVGVLAGSEVSPAPAGRTAAPAAAGLSRLLLRRDAHNLASSRRKSESEVGDVQTSVRTQSDRCRKSESAGDNFRSPRWLEAPDAADERHCKSAGRAHFQHV